MTKFIKLRWSEYRIQHIARHGITPEEVEEALLEDSYRIIRKGASSEKYPGKHFYYIFGITSEGRLLSIVLLQVESNVYVPITARDMDNPERKYYLKERR